MEFQDNVCCCCLLDLCFTAVSISPALSSSRWDAGLRLVDLAGLRSLLLWHLCSFKEMMISQPAEDLFLLRSSWCFGISKFNQKTLIFMWRWRWSNTKLLESLIKLCLSIWRSNFFPLQAERDTCGHVCHLMALSAEVERPIKCCMLNFTSSLLHW